MLRTLVSLWWQLELNLLHKHLIGQSNHKCHLAVVIWISLGLLQQVACLSSLVLLARAWIVKVAVLRSIVCAPSAATCTLVHEMPLFDVACALRAWTVTSLVANAQASSVNQSCTATFRGCVASIFVRSGQLTACLFARRVAWISPRSRLCNLRLVVVIECFLNCRQTKITRLMSKSP